MPLKKKVGKNANKESVHMESSTRPIVENCNNNNKQESCYCTQVILEIGRFFRVFNEAEDKSNLLLFMPRPKGKKVGSWHSSKNKQISVYRFLPHVTSMQYLLHVTHLGVVVASRLPGDQTKAVTRDGRGRSRRDQQIHALQSPVNQNEKSP